jgi:hypothetical protein
MMEMREKRKLSILMTNTGATQQSGELKLILPDVFEFLGSEIEPTHRIGDTIFYSVNNFTTRTISQNQCQCKISGGVMAQ